MVNEQQSPDWDKEFDDDYAGDYRRDAKLQDDVLAGKTDSFYNFVRDKTNEGLDKMEKRGYRKKGNVDKHPFVKHYRKMLPRAKEIALKERGVDPQRVKEHLTKRNAKFSPKARVTVGERKYKDTKRKAFYVTQGRKDRRRRFWGYLD